MLASFSTAAYSQDYPSKPVRLIVPFAPGGANDIIARIMGAKLTENWKQPVIVDNRGGAGGVIGTYTASNAAPDGYTLLMAAINFATNPALVKNLPYDPQKDFAAVSLLATSPLVLVIDLSLPARSVKELITLAKAKPGQLNYATPGAGANGHMAMELLKQMTEIDMVPVHYKSSGPALIDLIAGRVSPSFASILSVVPHIEAGRLRALAVSTPRRSSALPNLPTVAEAGVAGYEFTGWWGLVVPARTPQPIIRKLNGELVKILGQPEVRVRLLREGAEPAGSTPEIFAAYMQAETAKWSKVIKTANIRVE